MSSFATNKLGKVKFFGLTTASPDFLLKNGISFVRSGGMEDLFVETSQDGKSLVYLLNQSQQLRVVPLAKLNRRYAELEGKSTAVAKSGFDELAKRGVDVGSGTLVYQGHFEDVHNRGALIPSAYDAAKALGVTHATARWFGFYLVPDAFFGFKDDQEFTDQGFFIGPEGFQSAYSTIKRQLKLLQEAGTLAYESVPKEGGFYLRFNRQCLPGMNQELLPRFFTAFLF
ncbi:hypothetical protein [Hymenobacter sp. DG25B]|uniref:hypothetical protein n=1 Tax=Hymenobacter sp. DG25B TaxID=1385664 RepID=UPI0012E0024D|nr:hypothetical protein [Hymenobacter sp. DG25B]